MSANCICPSCGAVGMSVFYKLERVPVHSVLLLSTREEALSYPVGDIVLGFCPICGFIANAAFDSSLQEYAPGYEGTQSFSPTFNAFAHRLAERLIDQYDLHGKDIIEIGCGQGEFLTLLCELGDNRGIGFDPAYVGPRAESLAHNRATFIKDLYSERYAGYRGDFVCCKMTLEHIQQPADFISTVRCSLGDQSGTVVFFQVPDVTRILRERAFWDIYYEHCSYFSLGSLARLFRKCGFDVIRLAKEYDGQYLMIEARPGDGTGGASLRQEDDLEDLARAVADFSQDCPHKLDAWRCDLHRLGQNGYRAVIWGAGSKGVAFLTTLGVQHEIEYAVDINPRKHGTYMAGTGQQIVGPEFLRAYRPDVVIVMNPIYCDEIQRALDRMGIMAELVPV
jgi:SAM-dependent methyltransferase